MNLEKAKKKEKSIRTLEKLGYEVTLIKENRMVYSKYEQENKYCENCSLWIYVKFLDTFFYEFICFFKLRLSN